MTEACDFGFFQRRDVGTSRLDNVATLDPTSRRDRDGQIKKFCKTFQV